MDNIKSEQKRKLDNLIRASICSIRTYDEIKDLIKEGVIESWDDIHEIEEFGKKYLATHVVQDIYGELEMEMDLRISSAGS